MKFLFFVCLFITCISGLKSQDYDGYSYVDSKALRIPESETYSTASIANYIQSNFKTDKEKVRAIYAWITGNIKYNKDSMFFRYWGQDPEIKMASVLRKREGVCEDYASLFTNIAAKCGLQSVVISGYTKEWGFVKWIGHSWCAVRLGNDWLLCDPTWDEGFKIRPNYFLLSPEEFIQTHMPFDPLWQLLPYPVTDKEFQRGFTYAKKRSNPINVIDSVNAYLAMDTLQKLEAASLRIKQSGIDNEETRTWYAYNEMKIAIVYQEKDMNLYNSAVADLNRARKVFNDYVQYRNNRFIPERPVSNVNALFDTISARISSAYKTIDAIGKKIENYQYDTGDLKNSLDELAAKSSEQKEFLKRYLASNVADRERLFYKYSIKQ